MFFSTIIGDQTKVYVVRSDTFYSQKMTLVLFDSQDADRKGFGIRPKTSQAKNQFEDKDCDHTNFTGELLALDTSSFRKKADQLYGFPVLNQVLTYKSAPNQWLDINIPIFGYGPNYSFASDWRTYGSYEYQYEIFVRTQGDHVYLEQRSNTRRKNSPHKQWTAQIIRQIHEVDFAKNQYRIGSNVTTGSESNPNPIPMDWALILPGAWVTTTFVRIQSLGMATHPDFDLNFWERIFQEACYELGITDELLSFGDLAQSAIDSTRALDINTPAFLLDFLKTKDILLGIWRVLSGDLSPKALSSLFLSLRYGVNLTIRDAKELAEAIKQVQRDIPDNEYSIVRRGTSGVCTAYYTEVGELEGEWYHNFKMYYDPYPDNFRTMVRSMYSWDLFPSWQNLWDYIPFSFVLDWFLKIEDELERWDTRNYVSTLKFDSCVLTSKKIYPLPTSLLTAANGTLLLNNVNVVLYRRRVVKTPPMPISRLDSPSGPFTNWLEGSALFIQRAF